MNGTKSITGAQDPRFNAAITRRGLLKAGGGLAIASAIPGLPTGRFRNTGVSAQDVQPPSSDITATLNVVSYGRVEVQEIAAAANERFNQRYPNVTVIETYPAAEGWADFANRLIVQIAGGNVPDVIKIAIEGTRLVVANDLLEPLDAYVAADPDAQALLEGIDQPLLDAFTVDGNLYQVPQEWQTMVIYYNTKLFEQARLDLPTADWTWDDFLAAAQELTTGSGTDKVFGFAIPFFTSFEVMPWFFTNGTSPLTPDWSDSNLNDPKVFEAVQFVHDLVHVHEVSPAVEGTAHEQLFAAGRVAMGGYGHWIVPTFNAEGFRDYDVQYWPRTTAATNVIGGGGFGISRESANKALAWELIKAHTSRQVQEALAEIGSIIPSVRAVAESPEFLEFPANSEIFYESLQNSAPVPAPANFNEYEAIFIRHFSEIMSGGVSPEEGMSTAHEELSAAMARFRDE